MFGSGVVSLFSLITFVLFNRLRLLGFPLSKGAMGSRWELRHIAGSPGGGGVVSRLCHTLNRVNTV